MTEGFTELSGAAKDLQAKQAAKNTVINYQVPPAEGQGTYQQVPPTEGQAAYQQVMPIGGQTEYQTNGAPGYGTPPMGGMGYGNPTTPPRGTRAKKTNRSIWMYFLLSLVTCGIYGYVFIYNLAEDVNDICEGDGEKTSGLLAFILLGMVTCGIYYIIWWYKLANRLQANSYRYNVPIQENGTTFWYGHCLVLCSVVSDRGLPCILSLRIPISFVLFITSIMVWCKKEWLISQPLWYIIYLEVIGIEFPIALSKGKNYKKISILNFRR